MKIKVPRVQGPDIGQDQPAKHRFCRSICAAEKYWPGSSVHARYKSLTVALASLRLIDKSRHRVPKAGADQCKSKNPKFVVSPRLHTQILSHPVDSLHWPLGVGTLIRVEMSMEGD
jgi:hypothetical protein